MSNIKDISAAELEGWIYSVKTCTVGKGKAIVRVFRDKYGLTDRQATDILFRGGSVFEE
jgi:hypothetical protein